MSPRRIVCVDPKPPKEALKREVSKIKTKICDNFKKARYRISVTTDHSVAYGLSIGTDVGDLE